MRAASVAADAVRRPAGGTVVLIYHRVGGGTASAIDLPVARFDEQMAALAASGRVVTLDDAVTALLEGRAEAAGSVVVTFDDGTADFVEHALPVLVRHGIPATLYAATASIDTGVPLAGGGPPVSWGSLADACSTGLVDVGSHTHGHALLDRLPAGEVAGELDRSIDLIGEHLGRVPRHFAYPKAVPGSPAADLAVRERFRSAALAGTRANVPGRTDVHRLGRSPIQTGDGMRWFHRKVDGGMGLEDDLRRLLNRRRYAGAVS